MKKTIYRFILPAILMLSVFNSCKKDPEPTPEVEQEEYDAARIQFVALNPDGSETTDTTTINFSKEGVPTPSHTHLAPGASYRTLITLFYKGNVINSEIISEGTEHKFFFISSLPGGITDYSYSDQDADGRGIGLDGKMTIGAGEFDLNVVLRHGLDKANAAAAAWNSSNYAAAGGTDDLSVTFEVHAE